MNAPQPAPDVDVDAEVDTDPDPKPAFLDCVRLIERLHRRFLDVVKGELDRRGLRDINNVQAVLLSNIEEESVTVGELTLRGYYLGSNVSYNVKKLVENGYLAQERSAHDRRTMRIRVSDKGRGVVELVDALFAHNAGALAAQGLDEPEMRGVADRLRAIERFWTDYIRYVPR